MGLLESEKVGMDRVGWMDVLGRSVRSFGLRKGRVWGMKNW
jgi:hypothetical protein